MLNVPPQLPESLEPQEDEVELEQEDGIAGGGLVLILLLAGSAAAMIWFVVSVIRFATAR